MSNQAYIPHFDILKGIAIILVVMGHVMLFSFDINPSEPSKFIFFNMPLFFYISGYLAYKQYDSWKTLGNKFVARSVTLLLPYLVFIVLYNIFEFKELPSVRFIIGGGGRYWFLYCLFILSAFFMIYGYILRKIDKTWLYIALWLMPLCLLVAIKLWTRRMEIDGVLINQIVNYYRYYLIGFLCKKYTKLNSFLFENSFVCALGFIAYILNWYLFDYHNWILIFTGTLGAIIVLQTFVKRYILENDGIGKLLINIGKCSLGIYVIHYFFIPDISNITHGFLECSNPFIWQLTFAVIVAIPIIAASMFVYKLIEMNRWLSWLLLGKNNK